MRKNSLSLFFVVLICNIAFSQQADAEIPKNKLTEKAPSKYTKPGERDPFILPPNLKKRLKSMGAEKEGWPALKLYGILFGESGLEPKALINDDVVSVGDMIGPVKVTEIHKDSVKVELDGEFRDLIIEKK